MRFSITVIVVMLFFSCAHFKKFPKEKHYEFLYYFRDTYKQDTLAFYLKNPLMCPIRVQVAKDTSNLQLSLLFPDITLKEKQDTVVKLYLPDLDDSKKINYVVRYGDVQQRINKYPVALPFPKGKTYQVIQGYEGKFSHNTIYSKYALDFNLQIGDTITSVDDGYVVGLIEDYKLHGTGKKWLENDKSNYITVYHPKSGLFSQYVHLNHKGALVVLGEFVTKGQPVGICGMTGFTTTPHLHFTMKYPTSTYGLIGTEIDFDNGIKGIDLKTKDAIQN